MANQSIYITITHHFIEILALALLAVLGLEVLVKHLGSLLSAAHLLYLEVKSWKTSADETERLLD